MKKELKKDSKEYDNLRLELRTCSDIKRIKEINKILDKLDWGIV